MRRLLSYILISLYFLAMLKPVAPFIEYELNQDYIAEFLCINKSKPELNCKGKCYLMQKLQKAQEESEEEKLRVNLEDYPVGFVSFIKIKPLLLKFEQNNNTHFKELYKGEVYPELLKPPISC